MATEFVQKLFGLDGQIAVVIGGTGVLGGALCEGLAQAGATVVVAGCDFESPIGSSDEQAAIDNEKAMRIKDVFKDVFR